MFVRSEEEDEEECHKPTRRASLLHHSPSLTTAGWSQSHFLPMTKRYVNAKCWFPASSTNCGSDRKCRRRRQPRTSEHGRRQERAIEQHKSLNERLAQGQARSAGALTLMPHLAISNVCSPCKNVAWVLRRRRRVDLLGRLRCV